MTSGFVQELKTGLIKTERGNKLIARWRQDFLKRVGLFRLLADGNALLSKFFSRLSEQMHEGVEVMMHF